MDKAEFELFIFGERRGSVKKKKCMNEVVGKKDRGGGWRERERECCVDFGGNNNIDLHV
jgi:hypothetical protein